MHTYSTLIAGLLATGTSAFSNGNTEDGITLTQDKLDEALDAAFAKGVASVCTDTAGWISARYGYGCARFDAELCDSYGEDADENGVMANEACCVCNAVTPEEGITQVDVEECDPYAYDNVCETYCMQSKEYCESYCGSSKCCDPDTYKDCVDPCRKALGDDVSDEQVCLCDRGEWICDEGCEWPDCLDGD